VEKESYPDPTAEEGDWACVDLAAVKPMVKPVSLAHIKSDKTLHDMVLVRLSRLSVSPVTQPQFERVLEMGETKA
jgi:predicted RNA-binding protein with PUA-like domain